MSSDSTFRQAISALDAGDIEGLSTLLTAHPALLSARAAWGEGYFQRPYLLWFVAENPIRNGSLPPNIAAVTRTILSAADHAAVDLSEQTDYTLSLVASGRVPHECGVQRALLDVLVDAGADPSGALLPALAHQQLDAVERLLERGASLTLPVALCTDRAPDSRRLALTADMHEQQLALVAAALYGLPHALTFLLALGVDLDAFGPPGFHPHATALHQAVASGSLEAVKVLVEAGAPLTAQDRVHQGSPLDWAEYLGHTDIAAYLQQGDRAAVSYPAASASLLDPMPTPPLDTTEIAGSGLARMIARYEEQGTLTGDPDADTYLRDTPFAALLGMLYDQRMRAESAFTGPHRLRDRLGHLDPRRIAALPLAELCEAFAVTPAVHRFTNKMAEYTHAVAGIVAEEYEGDAAALWNDGAPFPVVQKRLEKLPGFGTQKARKMRFALHYFGYRDFSTPTSP